MEEILKIKDWVKEKNKKTALVLTDDYHRVINILNKLLKEFDEKYELPITKSDLIFVMGDDNHKIIFNMPSYKGIEIKVYLAIGTNIILIEKDATLQKFIQKNK